MVRWFQFFLFFSCLDTLEGICSIRVLDPENGTIFFIANQPAEKKNKGVADFKITWTWDCREKCVDSVFELNGALLDGGQNCDFGYIQTSILDTVANKLIVQGENVLAVHVDYEEEGANRSISEYSVFTVGLLPAPRVLVPESHQVTRFGKLKSSPAAYLHSVSTWIAPHFHSWHSLFVEVPFHDDVAIYSLAKAADIALAARGVVLHRAYVVSLPGSHARWEAARRTVADLPGVEPVRWLAVPLTDPRIVAASLSAAWEARSLSLQLSFRDAWAHFAAAAARDGGEDEWALFLEDDADWHPSLAGRPAIIQAVVWAGLAAGAGDGFAWLGGCNPSFEDRLGMGRQVWVSGAGVLARCSAHCAHGYALTRRLARVLASELEPRSDEERVGIPDLSSDHIDVRLRYWSRFPGPSGRAGRVLIGANLTAAFEPSFLGVLLQNRPTFPSVRCADGDPNC